jgi:hypothetical protein
MTNRWDEAKRHFEHGVAMNEAMGRWPWLAHSRHDYALMLLARGRTGDRTRAGDLLDRALG